MRHTLQQSQCGSHVLAGARINQSDIRGTQGAQCPAGKWDERTLQLFVLVICQSLLLFVGGLFVGGLLLVGFHHTIGPISLLHQGRIIMGNSAISKVLKDLVDFLSHDKDALLLFANSGTECGRLAFEACISDVVNCTKFQNKKVSIYIMCQ